MIAIPLLFGVFSIGVGLLMVFRSSMIIRFLDANGSQPVLHIVAVLARIVLGVALIFTAASSKFPVLFLWLGWLLIAAALVLALIGSGRFGRLMSWIHKMMASAPNFRRFSGLFAALFGAFMVYAYL